MWCLQVTNLKYKDTERWEGWEEMCHANINKKKGHIVILDEIDFKAGSITRDKEGYFTKMSQFNRKIK